MMVNPKHIIVRYIKGTIMAEIRKINIKPGETIHITCEESEAVQTTPPYGQPLLTQEGKKLTYSADGPLLSRRGARQGGVV